MNNLLLQNVEKKKSIKDLVCDVRFVGLLMSYMIQCDIKDKIFEKFVLFWNIGNISVLATGGKIQIPRAEMINYLSCFRGESESFNNEFAKLENYFVTNLNSVLDVSDPDNQEIAIFRMLLKKHYNDFAIDYKDLMGAIYELLLDGLQCFYDGIQLDTSKQIGGLLDDDSNLSFEYQGFLVYEIEEKFYIIDKETNQIVKSLQVLNYSEFTGDYLDIMDQEKSILTKIEKIYIKGLKIEVLKIETQYAENAYLFCFDSVAGKDIYIVGGYFYEISKIKEESNDFVFDAKYGNKKIKVNFILSTIKES